VVSLGSNIAMYIKGKRDVHTISLWYQFAHSVCMYFIPEKVQESFAQDADPAEANILAVVQQSFNRLLLRNQALRLGSSFRHGIRSLS
jgi:hypothetical protein